MRCIFIPKFNILIYYSPVGIGIMSKALKHIHLNDINIELLKNHAELLPDVAQIGYEYIGKIWVPGMQLEHAIERYIQHLNDSILPLTMVALYNKELIGICSLRENDGIRPDLTPWLGSLVVIPEYQKLGVGKMLIDAIKQKAKIFGFTELFLFAFDAAGTATYYNNIGWKIIGDDNFKNNKVIVMESKC